MTIVFDMDNTLTDEFGSTTRPGIKEFLDKLKAEGHRLILWTNSTRDRAKTILFDHRLKQYFANCIFREDYDPESRGNRKDIRKIGGDFLIDDDPDEIQYVKSIKKRGYNISSFRKGKAADLNEYKLIYAAIKSSR